MTTENLQADFPNFEQLVATEKLQYMHSFAKSSTIATVLAPLLCIPLYLQTTDNLLFNAWFAIMAVVVIARFFLIKKIDLKGNVQTNLLLLNIALGSVTFVWGMGWFIFVDTADPANYLIYQIISLTILFVGMVGYCVSWKSFNYFVLPLKLPELLFIVTHYKFIFWPIPIGSMVAFYLAIKMAVLFSRSWEKSFSLRLKNDAMIDQLVAEKNASIAANIAKSEFISTASHDLRQPMQSINIFVDMIDSKNLPEYENRVFSRMRNSIAVLNKMFNTLLDISKLDSGVSPRNIEFSIAQLANDLEVGFSDLCKEKKLSLTVKHEDIFVKGDPQLLEQVLRNLLFNAIQYTDTGSIVVSFDNEQGHLKFSVKDSGHGIPAEDLPVIFKEFFRSEHSRSHHDGLGLGLSIVNRIVQRIDGECTVNSEVGVGSLFTIQTRYPITQGRAFFKNRLNSQTAIQSQAVITPRSNETSHSSFGVNLGIIENDYSLKNAYAQYFNRAGYSVYLIPHEENEFTEYLAELPELHFILSDYRLGERNGIFFIQKLREEFNEDIPACIVTADTSPQHLKLFDQLNIHVLYKPIDIQSIESFIAKSLKPNENL
jgi:signal transduction histidine kinase/CheY-like chemotaxis protein